MKLALFDQKLYKVKTPLISSKHKHKYNKMRGTTIPLVLVAGLGLAGMLGCEVSQTSQSSPEISPISCNPAFSIVVDEEVEISDAATVPDEVKEQAIDELVEQRLDLMLTDNPDYENRDVLERVIRNREMIQRYSDLSGFPAKLVAAHLEVETTFDPFRKSIAEAYGLGQITKIAFRETLYTIAQVPSGFVNGKTKVKSLDKKVLAKQDYFKNHEQAFSELDPIVYDRLDEIFSEYEFSLKGYVERREERTVEFTELGAEYQFYKDKFKNRVRCKEIRERRNTLLAEQETDNYSLKFAVDQFWEDEVVVVNEDGDDDSVKAITNGDLVLWYQLNPDNLDEDFVEDLNILWSLNMRREYCQHEEVRVALDNGEIDLDTLPFQTAILGYNPSLHYLESVQETYAVVDTFFGETL